MRLSYKVLMSRLIETPDKTIFQFFISDILYIYIQRILFLNFYFRSYNYIKLYHQHDKRKYKAYYRERKYF
jgi:hypothetical protein